jgi:hypothetical protein
MIKPKAEVTIEEVIAMSEEMCNECKTREKIMAEKEITVTVPTAICYVRPDGFPILLVLDTDDEGKLTLKEAVFEDKHAGCFEEE